MPVYKDPRTRRQRYEALAGSLWNERQSAFDPHYMLLGDFLQPRRTRFQVGDRNKGDRRSRNIIDSTGRFATRTFAAGMHTGLTSPARPWMTLGTPDPDLAASGAVKTWLHTVTQRMLTVFASSNLYNVLPQVYLDLGIFGTAAMAIVEDDRDLFRCYSYPVGSYALGQDRRGLVTTFVRQYELTVRQIVEEFGVQADGRTIDWSTISRRVQDLWDRGDYEIPIALTWIVTPNEAHSKQQPTAKYKKWASCYFEAGASGIAEHKPFLRESGFDTFPIMCPRWDLTGEDSYGTDCPGMTALDDVRQLQIQQREKGKLIQKAVSPPLMAPTALLTQKVSQLPSDITFVDVRDGMQGLRPVIEPRLDGLQFLLQDMGEVQYRIQRAFYEDLFLMLARSDDRLGADRPTAREIEERHEEKWLTLGSAIERMTDELLDPIIDRAYPMMEAVGLLPEAPSELDGVRLTVEYTSLLSQAQKLTGVVAQDRLLQAVGGLAQVDASVLKKIKWFRVVNNYADMLGVDPNILYSDEEAQAALDSERQAQAEQMQAVQAATMAKAAKDASQAPVTGDTALARLVDSAQTLPGVAA